MSKYVWPEIWKDKLRAKFSLDRNGYVKWPSDITEILNIMEDTVREKIESESAPKPQADGGGKL